MVHCVHPTGEIAIRRVNEMHHRYNHKRFNELRTITLVRVTWQDEFCGFIFDAKKGKEEKFECDE